MEDYLFPGFDAGGRSGDHQHPQFVVDLPHISVLQCSDNRCAKHECEPAPDGNPGGIPHHQQCRGDQERPTHPEEAKQDADEQAEPDKQHHHRQAESQYLHSSLPS